MPLHCPNCGSENDQDAQFCQACGQLMLQTQKEPQVQSYNEQSSQYQPRQREQRQHHQRQRSSGMPKYDELICLLICCFVTPVGALIYYFLTEHEEKQRYQ